MRRRHTLILALLLTTAAMALQSCAHAPRVIEENEAVLSIRNDYLRSNPDGRFNDFIKRGEVVKGMNYVEVLAAWGFPQSRLHVPERATEYWRYVTRDEVSRDWVQYTFVFEKSSLSEWEMMRHASKGRAMAQIEFRDPTELLDPRMLPPESNDTVKK